MPRRSWHVEEGGEGRKGFQEDCEDSHDEVGTPGKPMEVGDGLADVTRHAECAFDMPAVWSPHALAHGDTQAWSTLSGASTWPLVGDLCH